MSATVLICTVGTSLLTYGAQLVGCADPDFARSAVRDQVVQSLLSREPSDRVCGAEINSVLLIERHMAATGRSVYFLHSETDEGRWAAQILQKYYELKQWYAETREVRGLRDDKPGQFRSEGLRRLAREMAAIVRERGAPTTIINATGGYKAQVAIAVLIGQAMGTTVYYKHERFNDAIDFPPMPVSFDLKLWLRDSALFFALDRGDLIAYDDCRGEWEEALEPLIKRVSINGKYYLELTPVGQVFHERLKTDLPQTDTLKPPDAPGPMPGVRLRDHDWRGLRERLGKWLNRLQAEKRYITGISDERFADGGRLGCKVVPEAAGRGAIRLCVPVGDIGAVFRVNTTAATEGQLQWVTADINQWLQDNPF